MSNSIPKVQTLSLKQFTAFEEAHFDFCPGINVLIGANGTGKTHVMKIIYTLLKVCEDAPQQNTIYEETLEDLLYRKLEGVFRFIEAVSDIIRHANQKKSPSSFTQRMSDIYLGYANMGFNFKVYNEQTGLGYFEVDESTDLPTPSPSIYLPAQEFLSIHEGFISAYTKRESAYDETYYNLSLALNALPLRKDKLNEVKDSIAYLKTIIVGEDWTREEIIKQESGRFYFDLPEGYLDVHLVAEGYRKIATLLYLLRNGSLTKDSILFWDEPEANLNPKLIVEVAKVLRMLASLGMQIFVATHDYLLSHELSLLAEYPSEESVDIKFFALHKADRKAGVLVESGQTLAELEHNPILEEFAAHYDREVNLFHSPEAVGS